MPDGSLIFDTKLDSSGLQKGLSGIGGLASTALKGTIAGLGSVTAGLTAGATAGVKYNATIENYQTSFEVMTGSAEKAKDVVDQLKTIGANTPFELAGLADTTQLLMNYGFTADDAINRMQMLGDISQGNADKMTSIATAYGQMSSAGKVQLEDVKQMIEAGFNPLQEITQSTGESMTSLYNRISKGTLSVDEITASMQRSTSEGGKYFQSMEKQSQTFTGQLSTLKDNANSFIGEVMQPISDSMTKVLIPTAITAIGTLQDAFEKDGVNGLVTATGTIINGIVANVAQYAPQVIELALALLGQMVNALIVNAPLILDAVHQIIDIVLTGIGDAVPIINPLTDAIKFLIDNLNVLIGIVAIAGTAFIAYKIAVLAMEAPTLAMAAAQTVATAAQYALNLAMSLNPIGIIIALIAALVVAFIYLWNNCDAFREFWIGLWDNISSFFIGIWNGIADFFTKTIPDIINNILNWFSQLPTNIQIYFSSMLDTIASWGANAINWVVTEVPKIIDGIVSFFMSLPDKILYFMGEVLGTLVAWGIQAITWVTTEVPNIINSIISFFAELPGNIWNFLTTIISNIVSWGIDMIAKGTAAASSFLSSVISFIAQLPGNVWNWLVSTVARVADWEVDLVKKGASAAKGLFDSFVNIIKGIPNEMLSIGKNIVQGLWNGITGEFDWIKEKGGKFASGFMDAVKKKLDINSPSKKFKWIGQMCVEGMAQPLEEYNPYDTLTRSMKANSATMQMNFNAGMSVKATQQNLINYDRLGESVVNAFVRSGTGVMIGEREAGRWMRGVITT